MCLHHVRQCGPNETSIQNSHNILRQGHFPAPDTSFEPAPEAVDTDPSKS